MGNRTSEQVNVTQDHSVHPFKLTFTEYAAHAIVLDAEDIETDETLLWLLRCSSSRTGL